VTLATTAAVVGALSVALPALPFSQQATTATFDLDHGNALVQVVFPRYDAVTRAESLGRPLLVVDRATQIEMPWFDALAPYHPTAVGIFSNLGRRPHPVFGAKGEDCQNGDLQFAGGAHDLA